MNALELAAHNEQMEAERRDFWAWWKKRVQARDLPEREALRLQHWCWSAWVERSKKVRPKTSTRL